MRRLYQTKPWIRAALLMSLVIAPWKVVFAQEALSSLFGALYQILLPGALVLGLVLIVVNGYGIMTSEGDPRKVQEAKDNLTSAIIGLVFILTALVIYRVIVTSLFGVPGDQAPFK